MKSFLFLGFLLLLPMQVYAEIFSWVDDSGTYNYTEDYSKVPKKYKKKVKRREELPQDVNPQESPNPENKPRQAEKAGAKSAVVPEGENELYDGKNRAAWRKELDVRETELSSIEQHMEQVRKQIYDSKVLYKDQLDALKKDYDDSRAIYDQKYKSYTELIETVRKAGITVDINK